MLMCSVLMLTCASASSSASSAPSASAPLQGFISFLHYVGPQTAPKPVLAALDLSSGKISTLAALQELDSSLLQQSTAFLDAPTNVWVLSMQEDANLTDGRLVQLDWATKKLVPPLASTYCWAVFSTPNPDQVLCLTEWPFWNYSTAPPRSPRVRRMRHREHRSAPDAARTRGAVAAPPLQQEQFILLLDRATGAATQVNRGWSDNDVPSNDVITVDRTDPDDHIIIAWMSDAVTNDNTLYTVQASTGKVLSKRPTSPSVILYNLEFNHASSAPGGENSNSTFGIATSYEPGKPFVSFFARFHAELGTWAQIGPSGTFDKYGYIEGVAAAAPSIGVYFAMASSLNNVTKEAAFTLLGVDTKTGLVVYEQDLSTMTYLSAIHYHATL